MKTVEEKMSAIAGIALYLEAAAALFECAVAKLEDLSQLLAAEEMSNDKNG